MGDNRTQLRALKMTRRSFWTTIAGVVLAVVLMSMPLSAQRGTSVVVTGAVEVVAG